MAPMDHGVHEIRDKSGASKRHSLGQYVRNRSYISRRFTVFGYVSLLTGLLLMAAIGHFIDRSISKSELARNEVFGLRTRATLASDDAWNAGHQSARPYLKATAVIGVIGFAVSLAALTLLQTGDNITEPGIYAIPIAVFLCQIGILIWGTVKANSAAKATLP